MSFGQETDLVAFQAYATPPSKLASEPNHVMVTPDDGAVVGVGLGPIHRTAGAELLVLEHLLSLEKHRHAGRGESERGAEEREFARAITVGRDGVDRGDEADAVVQVADDVVGFEEEDAIGTGRSAEADIVLQVIGEVTNVAVGIDGVGQDGCDGIRVGRVPRAVEAEGSCRHPRLC